MKMRLAEIKNAGNASYIFAGNYAPEEALRELTELYQCYFSILFVNLF